MTALPTKIDPRSPWTSDPLSPPDGTAWDLVVLGGGTAGIVAARTAAGFGASVVLIESERPGGDCLWTGCVPSKALLAAAHTANTARTSARFGIHTDEVRVDFAAVMARVHEVIAAIEPADAPVTLRAAGVHLAHATGRFTASDTIGLDTGERLRFRHALIATGSRPNSPPIPGLADVDALTSDDIWDLDERPRRLLVLGGGSIGCEMAQAFARLGSEVTIVEAAERLLAHEDPAAGALLAETLIEDGVQIHCGTQVVEVAAEGETITAHTDTGVRLQADRLLVAVGRRANTEGLDLARAGILVDSAAHPVVDERLRTSQPRVWAAGDVTGHPAFTHVAGVHGSLAASNAVLGLRRRVDLRHIPHLTYTQPEIASFGAAPGNPGTQTIDLPHAEVDRAVAEGAERGLTRLVLDRRGRVVGASVVGVRAGEVLAELVVAARKGATAADLAGTMHAYPGFADAAWKPAIEAVRERLARPATAWATGRLAALQRWRHRPLDAATEQERHRD
ncbi:MAG: FAD-dependent oxidoreductase [Nocardioidaceae bacterium]|nr:FAD-dependent oxidoreductase [Nocardioidaceae bacterium]